MTQDPREPRYIGITDYLELHPEKSDDINAQVNRMMMERLLRDGRCEFCNQQPIAWAHHVDEEIVSPSHSTIGWQWLTCAACEVLLPDGDDSALVHRMRSASPDVDLPTAVARLAAFRRADLYRYQVAV